jgi:type I restriction enzyme S subunit
MSELIETEIGMIPADWDLKTVDEIKSPEKKSIISGPFGSNISAKFFVARGVPVIRGNNLSLDPNKYFIDSGFVFITEAKAIELATWAEKEDIIFTAVGTIGQVGILLGKEKYSKYIISNKQLRLRVNKSLIEPLYAYYWFASPLIRDIILQRNTGSSVPLINLSVLKSLLIPIPPKNYRIIILNILSSLDDKIDLLHRQNATLEAMAEILFRQWFVEEAKEEWEEVDLAFVTKRITDGAHNSPPTTDIGLPMASVKDMHSWGINIDTCRKISKADFDELVRNDCQPLKNDIIIAKDGSYLKHVFVAPTDLDVVILSSIAILRPNGKYHPLLLATYLKLKSTIEQLENIVTGAVIPRIVLKDFRKFKIQLPPFDIQEEAIKSIKPLYEKCWHNINQIHTLTTLRDSLLPKLMSGEVHVK